MKTANKEYKLTGYYRLLGMKEWSRLDVVLPLTPKDIRDLRHPSFWGRVSHVRDTLFNLIGYKPPASGHAHFVDIDDLSVTKVNQ